MKQIIKHLKVKLIAKAKRNGIYENFGQEEVRSLEENFIDGSVHTVEMNRKRKLIRYFDEWCMNYTIK